MISSIPYIIERELLSNRKVVLPEVGTICIERVGASVGEDGGMSAPYGKLVIVRQYTESYDFIKLLAAHLKENSNVGAYFDDEGFENNAAEFYYEWYNANISSNGVVLNIEGVCQIEMWEGGATVTPTEALYAVLVPFGEVDIICDDALDSLEPERYEVDYATQSRGEQASLQRKPKGYSPRVPVVSKFFMVVSIVLFALAFLLLFYEVYLVGYHAFSSLF